MLTVLLEGMDALLQVSSLIHKWSIVSMQSIHFLNMFLRLALKVKEQLLDTVLIQGSAVCITCGRAHPLLSIGEYFDL